MILNADFYVVQVHLLHEARLKFPHTGDFILPTPPFWTTRLRAKVPTDPGAETHLSGQLGLFSQLAA